ncbi:4-hydroxy-4-methyl-2-oxoglutarate aldolase [Sphingomonas oligophenolica]|uniref:Putative 4-hydroxy-4-methyl-2-oxoglutarate aldolase n=1 Tax=Sphingomonas oligophenolica TaxID=301154 RepID=A0ABU9XWT2_9SPHN
MTNALDIRPMPAPVDTGLLVRIAQVPTSTIGHWRLWGFCRSDLHPLVRGPAVAGTAVTLALPGPDGALLHHALGLLRPGDILAIDRLGDDVHACVGGIVARAAKARGAAAILVDGPVTDTAELRDIDLPIWCRGTSARTTRRLGLGGRLNAPISVGGAVIAPGDILLCDADGILCLPAGEAEAEIARAAAHEARETAIVVALGKGQALENILAPPPLGQNR